MRKTEVGGLTTATKEYKKRKKKGITPRKRKRNNITQSHKATEKRWMEGGGKRSEE